jgi:predicted Zn-dependent protease
VWYGLLEPVCRCPTSMRTIGSKNGWGSHMKCQRWVLPLLLGCLLSSLPMAAQVEQPVGPQTPEGQKAKHDGSKDDIHAIGSRKIGKTGLGNWYSLEEEIGMGREYSKAVEATARLVEDPVVTEFTNRIGQNLVRNSDAKVPFSIKVIDSDEINAFALPGGFLYVNSGLILAAQDEAELAGIMAHEIAHVAARHATRQRTRSQMFNLASIPLIFVGGGVGLAVQQALSLAIPLSMTKFSRSFEAVADYLGVEYLYQTGYDPQAFISFFERVQAEEKRKPGLIAKAFSSHPQTADRIRKSQQEIARVLPAREAYVVTTSEFEDVKSRLAALATRRQPDRQEASGPTLRHKTPDVHDSSEDQRPTLRRRPD